MSERTWTATHWRSTHGRYDLCVTLTNLTDEGRPWCWEVWRNGLVRYGFTAKAWQAKLYARRAVAKLVRA